MKDLRSLLAPNMLGKLLFLYIKTKDLVKKNSFTCFNKEKETKKTKQNHNALYIIFKALPSFRLFCARQQLKALNKIQSFVYHPQKSEFIRYL